MGIPEKFRRVKKRIYGNLLITYDPLMNFLHGGLEGELQKEICLNVGKSIRLIFFRTLPLVSNF